MHEKRKIARMVRLPRKVSSGRLPSERSLAKLAQCCPEVSRASNVDSTGAKIEDTRAGGKVVRRHGQYIETCSNEARCLRSSR